MGNLLPDLQQKKCHQQAAFLSEIDSICRDENSRIICFVAHLKSLKVFSFLCFHHIRHFSFFLNVSMFSPAGSCLRCAIGYIVVLLQL